MTPTPSLDALQAIDPRAEPGWLRSGLRARHQAGLDCTPVLEALGSSDPVALAELLVGPRAEGALVPLALQIAPVLEDALSAPALYRRLADLAGDDLTTLRLVVQHLVEGHPAKSWVVTLCRRLPLGQGCVLHLLACENFADFGDLCLAYAQRGERQGLVEVAVATLRPEPLGALATVQDREALLDAAVAVLRASPASPVAAWLAAAWSPTPDPLLRDVAARVDGGTAAALLALCSAP